MCEAIFFVRDRVNADPYIDAKCYKRGFVVAVKPDEWLWSAEELSNPDWRILKVPNVTVAQAQSFLSAESEIDPQNPSRVLQRRGFKLDIDDAALPAGVAAWVADDSRAQPTFTVNFTSAQLMAFARQLPRRSDPNVLRQESRDASRL